MNVHAMQPPSSILFAWTARIALLLSVNSPFWDAIVELLQVPVEVKIFINPLLGSICAVILEAFNEYRKRIMYPHRVILEEPAWHLPAKVLIGWIAGGFSIELLTPFIKASEPTIAFYSGAAGTSFLSLYLSGLLRRAGRDGNDKNDSTS